MNEHGFCPNCKVDLDGEDIIQVFLKKGATREDAEKSASYYGYGPGHTKFGRKIGISNGDSVYAWACPDCKHQWKRFSKS